MISFPTLRFIVIDEIHTYRGVFGSHVANVLRRLERVTDHYHSHPQFFMTSATIGNAEDLAQKLTGQPATVISEDGAGHGSKNFLIYNPPFSNPDLGIRKSALFEASPPRFLPPAKQSANDRLCPNPKNR